MPVLAPMEEAMVKGIWTSFGFLVLLSSVTCQPAQELPENWMPLTEFTEDFSLDRVSTDGEAEVDLVRTQGVPSLRVRAEGEGLSVKVAAEKAWDLSGHLYVRMDLLNSAGEELFAKCLINGMAGMMGAQVVPAGEIRTLAGLISRARTAIPESVRQTFFGMNGLPGGFVGTRSAKDPRQIEFIEIQLPYIQPGDEIEISSLRAEGVYNTPEWNASRFPLLDEFGQLREGEWPGKIHSLEELRASIAREDEDLAAHPGPSEWNQYGGWEAGPTLEATGHFRVEKYEGKWWLVDPLGKLFWSHGIDVVTPGALTPVTDREHYFTRLPEDSSKFYSEGEGAAREYYKNRSYRIFNLFGANLEMKYQTGWYDTWTERAHQRLRSWGFNTAGNWTAETTCMKRKTPYVVYLQSRGPRISAAEGFWRKFPDPFDSGFREGIGRLKIFDQERIAFRTESFALEKGKSTEDPWCIGYFVDNEASWGDDKFLASGVLQSPRDQAAKLEFLRDLRKRYRSIGELNKAWESSLDSWDDFLESREVPKAEASQIDLRAFTKKIATQYFRLIRDRIREIAPNKLYLGARFFTRVGDPSSDVAWMVPIAAEFCDVVSFNRYRYTTKELQLPDGVDRPIIIGEWHIGALDRGMLHTGLRSAYDQKERAELYKFYVRQALENPFLVGTHWYQLNDQVTTGRNDGENYQIGFLSICDNPHTEMVAASRTIGSQLYQLRAERR
jgi:hypothetical protein